MDGCEELAIELERMLIEDRAPQVLGEWLVRHGPQIIDALKMSDDLVMIPEIDLKDMVRFVREQDAATAAGRPPEFDSAPDHQVERIKNRPSEPRHSIEARALPLD